MKADVFLFNTFGRVAVINLREDYMKDFGAFCRDVRSEYVRVHLFFDSGFCRQILL